MTLRGTVGSQERKRNGDDLNPALPHNKEYTTIPIVWGP